MIEFNDVVGESRKTVSKAIALPCFNAAMATKNEILFNKTQKNFIN